MLKDNLQEWKKIVDSDNSIWRTPQKKNGECDYVLSRNKIEMYFTVDEFLQLIDSVRIAEDKVFKPKDGFYL